MANEKKLRTFTEVHRPPRFDGIIDVKGNISKVKHILNNKIKQNFLLVGPPGTGKTTTAFAIAREFVELNLSPAARMMISNLDECIDYVNASKAGIDTVRNLVEPLVSISGVNVMILDEFDGITKQAQNALRPTMEEAEQKISPKLFILTANYINKIIDPIVSRCGAEAFVFPKIPMPLAVGRLKEIIKAEGISEFTFPPDVVDKADKKKAYDQYWKSLYDMVNGDMRKALKHLHTAMNTDETGRKSLDMSSEPVDLTTNAYYLQLDEILLSGASVDYTKFTDSIEELIYRRDSNAWETSSFFYETFRWIKTRSDRFEFKTLLELGIIVAEYEFRLGEQKVELMNQMTAMISEMHRYLRMDDLEKKQQTEMSKNLQLVRELVKELKT